jgi:hypothetical protein
MKSYPTNYNPYTSFNSAINLPDPKKLSVEITLEITDYKSEEISSLENFQNALKDTKIHPDAPSYIDLLKKYHPEFLL